MIVGQHVRMGEEDGQVVQQQVAEVAGVEHLQPVLIGLVELLALVVGEMRALGRRQLLGRPAAVLPVVDQAGQGLGRPALGVDVLGFQQLLDQPFLIVRVEDGVVGFQPDQLGVAAQDLGGDGVEGAQPAQALGLGADDVGDAFPHLLGRLVGEGDREQLPRLGPAGGENVGQTGGQHAGLAGAGAGQDQDRPLGRLDRRPLLGVQPLQIVRTAHASEIADAGGGGGIERVMRGHWTSFSMSSADSARGRSWCVPVVDRRWGRSWRSALRGTPQLSLTSLAPPHEFAIRHVGHRHRHG
ncbi:hypothetical protein GALL_525140 [mine drainage metagenome]|uniref:Uncharacterized protein n=1 Tax=mine drainage metagenome TaxID=410659 RepID=A0A1J5PKV7_9ZZZZ